MLDEPTHHLDLAGKDVLEDALDEYAGAVLVVTHDRSLMARVTTRVLEVNDGRVVMYPGGYEDYERARMAREEQQGKDETRATGIGTSSPVPDRAPKPRQSKAERLRNRDAQKKDRAAKQKRDREIARIEGDIETREARIKELEARLADPEAYRDGQKAGELVREYEALRTETESLWQRLEELTGEGSQSSR
jgi:ATP-binding cassette subfamily F protein 3